MAQRSKSQKRREREARKQYEKEHPDLGGYVWQAIMISLVGVLFCAGRNWEDKVEEAKKNPESSGNGSPDTDDGDRERRHRHHRRRRAGSDGGDRDSDRGYLDDGRGRERRGSERGGYERGIGMGSVAGSVREEKRGSVAGSVRGDNRRGSVAGSARGDLRSDPRISYIPAAIPADSRYRASDDGTTHWVMGEDMYEVEESPPPRRRRVRRESLD